MNRKIRIGLLPFYIKLYDDAVPEFHPQAEQFAKIIAEQYERLGFEVERAPVCRIRSEFASAVRTFEKKQCEAIVTLHLAYSPSLESAEILAKTRLPLVVLDTTPDFEFGFDDYGKLMANHGIHGVQDMCNMLIRNRKQFLINAGHWQESDVLKRSAESIRAAAMAWKMQNLRIGAVGGEFAGMGDFRIPDGTFGMKIIRFSGTFPVTETEISAETAADRKRFLADSVSDRDMHDTEAAGLRIRRWAEREKLDAFTVCFLGISRKDGWNAVPFLEGSKALARGIGYAGEGDVLTAGFAAAVLSEFPQTTFSEMFCPDWAGNRLFVSHMGEVNLNLLAGKPLLSKHPYLFSDTGDLVTASGILKAGKALLLNLAPGPEGSFTLIAARVKMTAPKRPARPQIEGWFTPEDMSIPDFLESYSRAGGTHHLLLSCDSDPAVIKRFASLMNWKWQGVNV